MAILSLDLRRKTVFVSYSKIMFDLDGTLIHSKPGIIKALRLAMADMGLPERDDEYMCNLIGPPFQLGFPRYLGLKGEEIDRMVGIYMRYAAEIFPQPGMLTPFPGAVSLLSALHSEGRCVGIVTSKGAKPANEQIDLFGFRPYLSFVMTADNNGNGEKTELLQKTCGSLGKDGLVMVGDRFYDLDAAHACGVDSIGVLYGYASPGEIQKCDPTYIVSTMEELHALLLQR